MLSFSMGLGYLRNEALKSGFISESDNDSVLVERLSQVVRKLDAIDAEKCDALTAGVEWKPQPKEEPAKAPKTKTKKKVSKS